jgi:hypothetical protein
MVPLLSVSFLEKLPNEVALEPMFLVWLTKVPLETLALRVASVKYGRAVPLVVPPVESVTT